MSDWKLNLYHQLPPFARSWMASARGYQLRNWRYSAQTDRLVEAALTREQWSTAQWQSWREERLAFVLHRAATRVPFYRDQWSERRRRGDKASWEILSNWPILEKETLRAHNAAFVADDCEPRRMFHDHTSGTTGKSLDLWYNRATVQQWYALFEARWRQWYGVSRHDRWAIIGGQLITPVEQRRPPFWVWNAGLNQLYCSSYHLAPDLVPFYFDALKKYGVQYLLGYTSSLLALAEVALQTKRNDMRFKVVITNAEPVFDYQREIIEAAFQCPLRETYGMAEMITAASQCDAGTMHLWPEAGQLEIVAGQQTLQAGACGELIGTSLLDADMPLIRYRVGDRAALAAAHDACACGRSLPHLQQLEGRTDDMLFTLDGRRVGRLDPVFKARLPVKEAQIIQEQLDRIRVRYVPTADFDARAAASIVERLQARFGQVQVVLEECRDIPRGPSGKFRAVICQLPAAELQRLKAAQPSPSTVAINP